MIPSWADPEQIQPLAKAANPFVATHQLEERFAVLSSGNQGRCHDLLTLLAREWGLSNCNVLAERYLQLMNRLLPLAEQRGPLAICS